MNLAGLATFEAQRRYATLVALAIERMVPVIDQIIGLHARILGKLFIAVKNMYQLQFQASGRAIIAKMRLLGRIGRGQAVGPRCVRSRLGRHVLERTALRRHLGARLPSSRILRTTWLFAGSLRGGQRAAAIMSLIQSARLNGHDPYVYLKDALMRLPTQKNHQIAELLPHRWRPAT